MMKPTTMKTFESCNLAWLECSPDTPKPDWLPGEVCVRYLTSYERSGEDEFDPYSDTTAHQFFGDGYNDEHTVGWYPVTESLVPQWLLDGVEEPPKGWRYYGKGPVKEHRGLTSADISLWCAVFVKWNSSGWCGTDDSTYYAIREGSDLYKKIWPDPSEKGLAQWDGKNQTLTIETEPVQTTIGLLNVSHGVRTAVTMKEFLEQHPEFVLKSAVQPPALLGDALSAVREWTEELGMTEETYLKVRHFVEWYYAQTTEEGGVK